MTHKHICRCHQPSSVCDLGGSRHDWKPHMAGRPSGPLDGSRAQPTSWPQKPALSDAQGAFLSASAALVWIAECGTAFLKDMQSMLLLGRNKITKAAEWLFPGCRCRPMQPLCRRCGQEHLQRQTSVPRSSASHWQQTSGRNWRMASNLLAPSSPGFSSRLYSLSRATS